jgi:hypothetical protein
VSDKHVVAVQGPIKLPWPKDIRADCDGIPIEFPRFTLAPNLSGGAK